MTPLFLRLVSNVLKSAKATSDLQILTTGDTVDDKRTDDLISCQGGDVFILKKIVPD